MRGNSNETYKIFTPTNNNNNNYYKMINIEKNVLQVQQSLHEEENEVFVTEIGCADGFHVLCGNSGGLSSKFCWADSLISQKLSGIILIIQFLLLSVCLKSGMATLLCLSF